MLFLKNFSRHTWLYEDGTSLDFVRELHRRWQSMRRPGEHPSLAPAGAGSAEPEEMPAGAIFISYSSGDRSAAERIAAGLNEAGLDVWLDRGALKSGDRYESKIRRHITRCDLFLPLLSRETETREEAFFRREWAWALARAEAHGSFTEIHPAALRRSNADPLRDAARARRVSQAAYWDRTEWRASARADAGIRAARQRDSPDRYAGGGT